MKKVFWLIQTGVYNTIEKDGCDHFIYDGPLFGRDNACINLNYMGAAEYEGRAISDCLKHIREHSDNYEVVVTDILNTNGVPLILCCYKDNTKELIRYIKEYIEEPYLLKAPCGLEHHCKHPHYDSEITRDHYIFMRTHNQFWIDLEFGWFATFGAADRVHFFENVLSRFQKQRNGENK